MENDKSKYECNNPDHDSIHAERQESVSLHKAWIEADNERMRLRSELEKYRGQLNCFGEDSASTALESMINVKCLIAVVDASGGKDLIPVTVQVSQEDFDNGKHYAKAEEWAENKGYSSVLVIDETEITDPVFMDHVDWEKEEKI